jgi:ribulose-5-phosphate 4-epimerase/fuculose-1-phosphate aldolase
MSHFDQEVMSKCPKGMEQDEWAHRVQLALCYRLFDHLGWAELIFNHITLRTTAGADGQHRYLINPFGLHYTEVTAHNLIAIDVHGALGEGQTGRVNRAGFVIHSAIHAARADAHCVMHTHTTAGSAVACKSSGLRHDNFYSALLFGDVGYHDYEGVTTNTDEQPRLVASLGQHHHLILRNHGLLSVGTTLPEAFQRLWLMQRACEIQLASDAGAGSNIVIDENILRKVPATRLQSQADRLDVATLGFDAMCRRAGLRPLDVT